MTAKKTAKKSRSPHKAPTRKEPVYEAVVTARCISCRKTKEVRAGDVPKGDMPFCDSCGSICVAVKAETRRKR